MNTYIRMNELMIYDAHQWFPKEPRLVFCGSLNHTLKFFQAFFGPRSKKFKIYALPYNSVSSVRYHTTIDRPT